MTTTAATETILRDALREIVDEAQRQCMRGESVTYTTASEPIGIRGGQITTRVGDLCDMRDAIQRIATRALATPTARVGEAR